MSRITYFVDVILPLAVPSLYTYRVPYNWNDAVAVGKRVVVQFGRGKLYSALVRKVHESPPKHYDAKYIDSILDEFPIVNIKQFALWDWMSQYYMCHIGDVMVAALPGGLRLASETKIVLNPEYNKLSNPDEGEVETNAEPGSANTGDIFNLSVTAPTLLFEQESNNKQAHSISDKEYLIIDALEIRTVLSINDVSEILEQKTVYPVIKSLIEKGVVLILEELKEKFKPKIESFVRFTAYANDEENLKIYFSLLEKKAPKQLDVLIAYIKLSERYSVQSARAKTTEAYSFKEVKKSDLIKMIPGAEAAIKSLVQKNIFEIYEREVGRFASFDNSNKISQLNEVQQQVYESIQKQFGWKKVESSKLKVQSSEFPNDLETAINNPEPEIEKDIESSKLKVQSSEFPNDLETAIINPEPEIEKDIESSKLKVQNSEFTNVLETAINNPEPEIEKDIESSKLKVQSSEFPKGLEIATNNPKPEIEKDAESSKLKVQSSESPKGLEIATNNPKSEIEKDAESSKLKVQSSESPKGLEIATNNPKSEIEKDVVLLHGVTSSGKTEIYVKLIEQAIAQGKQVLYLLPEIALTTQIINRLRKYFGDTVGVYHSKFNENERVEVWNNVLKVQNSELRVKSNSSIESHVPNSKLNTPNFELVTHNYKLIVGARSSLFLPFSNLGLIIVDEEHDTSYKQYDPAPRYNARDGAIFLAHIHKAKTLLGSATPSLESYYNAQEGKYGFAEITQRFGNMQMPEILIADVKEATRKKLMKSHFSPLLLDTVTLALQNKEQVILFQNRRGFAPQLECNTCAWIPQCTNCDVSLTYHKASNQLRCHYCGYSIKPPNKCAACGDTNLRMKGFGTEKIEEELSIFYPKAKIARMDLDTTRSKFAHQHIIQDFEEGNIDILVGTQMVTKGLDFDNVSMVGILNADSMLNFPDFRSFERSFQLMAQVSGRAGRKNKRGKVIIQAQNPDHSIIQDVIHTNFLSMYTHQLLDRKNFNYPPFYRLIEITLIHRDINMVNASAKYLADELKHHFKNRVLGPEFPIVSRIRNLYHKNILLKIEREASVLQVKKILNNLLVQFKSGSDYKSVRIQIDVDPM